MKTLIAPALIAFAAVGFSHQGIAAADHDGHGDHGAMHAQPNADDSLVNGLVKKIDKSAGKVTVSHGPLPNGMPAMTMVFQVKETTWIDKLKEGQEIRFAAAKIDGAMTLVRIEPVK